MLSDFAARGSIRKAFLLALCLVLVCTLFTASQPARALATAPALPLPALPSSVVPVAETCTISQISVSSTTIWISCTNSVTISGITIANYAQRITDPMVANRYLAMMIAARTTGISLTVIVDPSVVIVGDPSINCIADTNCAVFLSLTL